MAHKKGVGSSRNGRDSNSQRRGVKAFGGQFVKAGTIIVRQCGTRFLPGQNAGIGRDNTIYARVQGLIEFKHRVKDRTFVNVKPVALAVVEA